MIFFELRNFFYSIFIYIRPRKFVKHRNKETVHVVKRLAKYSDRCCAVRPRYDVFSVFGGTRRSRRLCCDKVRQRCIARYLEAEE